MDTGDRGDQAEAKPIARRLATSFKPVEALEDLLIFIGGNSRSIIGNRNDWIAVALFDLYRHVAFITPMFDSIVDEIGDSIEQEISVAPDKHAHIPDSLEVPALVFGRGVE